MCNLDGSSATIRFCWHPCYPNVTSTVGLDGDAGLQDLLCVQAVSVAGNETVPDSVMVRVQYNIAF